MPRQPQPASFDGALVINKPQGKTSHDVVDAVRHLAGFRQIGHLGTLDPLATGVLVLLLGKATRFVRFYTGRRKRYTAGFRFGFATNTYDSEGQPAGPDIPPTLDREALERLAAESTGRFEQMPPIFSAKKVQGRPAYELARKNQAVELKPVPVEIFEYRLLEIAGPVARFSIECSSGNLPHGSRGIFAGTVHQPGRTCGSKERREVRIAPNSAGESPCEFSAHQRLASARKENPPWREIQRDAFAVATRARGAASRRHHAARHGKCPAAAPPRLQSAK